jgi:hypothetical protein
MDLRIESKSHSPDRPIPVVCDRFLSTQLHRDQLRAEKQGNLCERCVHVAERERTHLSEIPPNRIANFDRAIRKLPRSKDYESSANSVTFSMGESTCCLDSIPFLKLATQAGASFADPLSLLPRDNRVGTGMVRGKKNRVSPLGVAYLRMRRYRR